MNKEQYMKTIESIIKSNRNDSQKIGMLQSGFVLFVRDYNKQLVEHISCPFIEEYGECKFGWHTPEQSCEECLLEWLNNFAEINFKV